MIKPSKFILERIYDKQELKTNIPKDDLKNLLEFCTKHVHFSFENVMYKQSDGVAMGSPLGPVLAGIFMVDLETKVLPKLRTSMTAWKRYVDDTIAYIKEKDIDKVLKAINDHHDNIKFTYELESDNELSFLDVKIRRFGNNIQTSVYRKPTNTDLYLHWNSFAPNTWKKGTLRTLILRAHTICSNEELFAAEIAHLKHVFHNINGYPKGVISQIIREVNEKFNQPQNCSVQPEADQLPAEPNKRQVLCLPYQGKKGENIMRSMNRTLNTIIGNQIETRVVYNSTKLSSFFSTKDKIAKEHQNNVVYKIECPNENCEESYTGETNRRIFERVKDHSGRDKNSTVFRHSVITGHKLVTMTDVKIIAKGFKGDEPREIAEAFLIKEQKPSLNIQNLFKTVKLFT